MAVSSGKPNPSTIPYSLAMVSGLLLWGATAYVNDGREPWDTAVYWSVSYPAAIVLCGVLGLMYPHKPWRWAAALMYSQILVMFVGGSGFGLLPLGIVLIGILTVPAAGLAELLGRLRLRFRSL